MGEAGLQNHNGDSLSMKAYHRIPEEKHVTDFKSFTKKELKSFGITKPSTWGKIKSPLGGFKFLIIELFVRFYSKYLKVKIAIKGPCFLV